MVQILQLNKMVHLKCVYPILEIWCCHKHIHQLPPSWKAEIWHKVEESAPKQSGSIALHNSFSQAKYSTQLILSVCSSQSLKYKYQNLTLRFLATFGTCYSSQMPFSRLKCGKKLRNMHMSPSRFVSTALRKSYDIVTGKVCRVLHVNFECLFWPIKCMHSKPRFWVHFGHCFAT